MVLQPRSPGCCSRIEGASDGPIVHHLLEGVELPASRLLFGEMSIVLLEGQRAIPRRLLDLGFNFRFGEAEAALRDLLQ